MTINQFSNSTTQSIDPSALIRLKKMGGDILVVKMINLFLENVPQKIDIMKQAIREIDYKSLEMAAHSLKSSAGNMGAVKLQEAADEIELLVSDKQARNLVQMVDSIEMESKTVLKILKNKKSEFL